MARIDDGFSTTITFALGALSVYEKEVTPPGIDGGGPNDTSTMRNTAWRTMAPKGLKTLTQMSFVAAYDPVIYTELLAQININQVVQILFADGSFLQFYGWVDKVNPNRVVEGEQPTCELIIECSNQDENGDESAPSFTPA